MIFFTTLSNKNFLTFKENNVLYRLTSFAPNTYTFTKLMAEQICHDYKRDFDLPIVIYRPSIVSCKLLDNLKHVNKLGLLISHRL